MSISNDLNIMKTVPMTDKQQRALARIKSFVFDTLNGSNECCQNPTDCWEPCGELGNDIEYARVSTLEIL